ncbi:MAG: B12-binding domain-containing protein [Pirellulaceae bacterium]
MSETLSPRQVGEAIQISESSIKRWCDRGKIKASYTAGGHRRIHIADLVEFLRDSKYRLIEPEAIGLPEGVGAGKLDIQSGRDQFTDAIRAGDETRARSVVVELFLNNMSMAEICDQVFAPAFHVIGESWQDGNCEVYEERRACEIGRRVLSDLRELVPPLPTDAPVAIGGSPSGDYYDLPTQAVELVLQSTGIKAKSLGTNLPLDTLAKAIVAYRPKLVWISATFIDDVSRFVNEYRDFHDSIGNECQIVLGGQAIDHEIEKLLPASHFSKDLSGLAKFASSVLGKHIATSKQDSNTPAPTNT